MRNYSIVNQFDLRCEVVENDASYAITCLVQLVLLSITRICTNLEINSNLKILKLVIRMFIHLLMVSVILE